MLELHNKNDKDTIELFASILSEELEITFTDEKNGFIYNIFWSECSEGWDIDLFINLDSYEDNEPDDGGICTGSAKDAIEFFIVGESDANINN